MRTRMICIGDEGVSPNQGGPRHGARKKDPSPTETAAQELKTSFRALETFFTGLLLTNLNQNHRDIRTT